MGRYAAAYLGVAIVFLALDSMWLGILAKEFYRSRLGDLLLERPNLPAAAVFYGVYWAGIVLFGVAPAVASQSWGKAAMMGGLFGFFAYATYDLTNLATLKGWPVSVVVIDVIWGTISTAVASALGYAASVAFSR